MKVLKLKKRGCDFWENSQEKNLSDLENFRLYGKINPKEVTNKDEKRGIPEMYHLEICTNIQNNKFRQGIYSFIRVQYDIKENEKWTTCWGSLEKDGMTQNATKQGVLDYINNAFGTNFTKLQIVDNL